MSGARTRLGFCMPFKSKSTKPTAPKKHKQN